MFHFSLFFRYFTDEINKFYKIFVGSLYLLALLSSISTIDLSCSNATFTASNEYQIKAVFLYNFTKGFIKWPATSFTTKETPFQICLIGEDNFRGILENTVKDQKAAGGRSVIVNKIDTLVTLSGCHILFISTSAESQLSKILEQAQHYSLLTVSDIEDFTDQGGMIEFFTLENKIKFAINSCILEQAGLKADANLLRIARLTRC